MDSWISTYLFINIFSFSDIVLIYFECILDCLWLCLANSEGAKDITRDICIMITNIKNTYTKNIYISNIDAIDTWIRCIGIRSTYIRGIYTINALIWGIILKILIELEVILVDSKINNWCLRLLKE